MSPCRNQASPQHKSTAIPVASVWMPRAFRTKDPITGAFYHDRRTRRRRDDHPAGRLGVSKSSANSASSSDTKRRSPLSPVECRMRAEANCKGGDTAAMRSTTVVCARAVAAMHGRGGIVHGAGAGPDLARPVFAPRRGLFVRFACGQPWSMACRTQATHAYSRRLSRRNRSV